MPRAMLSWNRSSRLPAIAALFLALAAAGPRLPRAHACDICAIYIATEIAEGRTGPRLGLAQQFTHFGTLEDGGRKAANPAGERIDSSITQLIGRWQFTHRLGVQLNVPLISRHYRRVLHDGRIRHGDETGLGDLAVLADVLIYSRVTTDAVLRWSFLAGLELPSGDTGPLAEELRLADTPRGRGRGQGRQLHPRHGGDGHGGRSAPSGVHGHDLALGSGSVDGIVGTAASWSWRRLFITAALQYAIRREGDFAYRYANDLVWDGGPGVYLLLDHRYTLGLQAMLAGETKGKDTQQGRRLDDTAVTRLSVGPGLHFTWSTSLAASLAVDLPVIRHNTALQIVPDYRVRGGLTWRF